MKHTDMDNLSITEQTCRSHHRSLMWWVRHHSVLGNSICRTLHKSVLF